MNNDDNEKGYVYYNSLKGMGASPLKYRRRDFSSTSNLAARFPTLYLNREARNGDRRSMPVDSKTHLLAEYCGDIDSGTKCNILQA